MDASWVDRLKVVARRNRPSRKPQLWENFPLAVRRRIELEFRTRTRADWLDKAHLIDLSDVGFEGSQQPLRMEVVPREVMNKALFLYGTFEVSETRLVQALLRPGMTYVDVGANIGYYTLIAARLVEPGGVVHSFEPNIDVRAGLARNVELNGFKNVQIHAEAMARHSGEISFYASARSENSGISSIVPGTGLAQATVITAISLDDFVATLPDRRIDLLKMDIEGAELQVIEGGEKLLSGPDAPSMLFESFDVDPILAALSKLGYHTRRLHYSLAGGLELPPADAPLDSLFAAYESPNYFAVKDERQFDFIVDRVNSKRSSFLRLLGRI